MMFHRRDPVAEAPAPVRRAQGACSTLLLLCAGLLLCETVLLAADPSAEVKSLTSARTRLVWVQDQTPAGLDTLAHGKQLRLMGFDSHDGRGERVILGTQRNYAKPLLTPDGRRVVYSDHATQRVYVVNFDGTEKRQICEGLAIEVWNDPADGVTWVYTCKHVGDLGDFMCRNVRRLKLDDPRTQEMIWDKTEISPDNFQLSADGLSAGGEFPWPNGGVADLTTRTWTKLATGCWSSLAPDNSRLCWVFDGPHRNLRMFPPGDSEGWTVNINSAPGIDGFEVFHPRWSNHVRFFAMTGPYKIRGRLNMISGGGPGIEIYLGRFSEDFTRVEAWAQVSRNERADFHPDAWIEEGAKSSVPVAVISKGAQPPADGTTPLAGAPQGPAISAEGLEFFWERGAGPNQLPGSTGPPPRSFRVEPHGRAWYDAAWSMQLAGGWFLPAPTERLPGDAFRKSGALTLEAVLTPLSINPAATGQIITFGGSAAPSAGAARAPVSKAAEAPEQNFSLMQSGERLLLSLKTHAPGTATAGQPVPLGKLEANKPLHLVVTCSGGELLCYHNGQAVKVPPAAAGDFRNWTDQPLAFGAAADGTHSWRGRLAGIGVYSRAVSPAEVAVAYKAAAARLEARVVPSQVVVRARRVEVTAIPDPRSIAPYRRALAVHRYQVEKIEQGRLDSQEFLAAHWSILDGAVLPEARRKAGETVVLTLEPFEAHPELKGERQIMDTDRIELPLYYDVSPEPGP